MSDEKVQFRRLFSDDDEMLHNASVWPRTSLLTVLKLAVHWENRTTGWLGVFG